MDIESTLAQVVASRIQAEMTRRKMTRRHLAKRSGVSEGTIRRILRGENTSLDTIALIADALRVEAAALVSRAA